mgnify:CR=1 FL=1
MGKINNNEKSNKERFETFLFIVATVILVVGAILINMFFENKNKEKELPYNELLTQISEQKVEKIKMITGSTTVEVVLKGEGEEKDRTKHTMVPSVVPFVELVQEKIDKKEVDLELIQEPVNIFIRMTDTFFSILPTILLVVLMVMVFKMQGLGSDSAKVFNGEDGEKPDVRFKDIAGLDEEKGELIELVDFLKKPDEYVKMGAKIPRGVLLYGKPGTGKTLIAKAIAGEADVPFISMSGSEFIEMFAGLGASRVRKLFEKAKKMAPCIIFIDEIDAIGSRRTSNSGAETENNQTLNQLLVEMDGFNSNETIIVLAATNRPEMLDKALLRPGRFDRQITVPTPDIKGREEILKLHAEGKKFSEEVDFKALAGDTAGFTGAELANVLNEAAIIATRLNKEEIEQIDIENAIKKLTVGLEKLNRVISDKDKKLTAYHEAGHAVVSRFLETQSDVKEVSIIPRGLAGGYTMYKTDEDKFYVSRTELLEKMVALMGGRAAEKLVLNEISTGASNDLEVATGIAKDMLTIYGMSDSIGPISLKVDDPYEMQVFGEKLISEVGEQIQLLIDNAYLSAQRILSEHRDLLDKVANTLLEKEKINADEFDELCRF